MCVSSVFTSQVKRHLFSFSLLLTHTHTLAHSPVLRSSPRAALCGSCCKFVYVCPVFTIPPPHTLSSPLSLIFLHPFFGLSCETEVRVRRLKARGIKHEDHKLMSRKTLRKHTQFLHFWSVLRLSCIEFLEFDQLCLIRRLESGVGSHATRNMLRDHCKLLSLIGILLRDEYICY